MKKIKLQLDYLQGAIWISDFETGTPMTGISVVDKDDMVKNINYTMQDMYSSYYEFDSHGQACFFDKEKQKVEKDKMLELLEALKKRLNEINDGSYQVEDCISTEYEKL